MAEISLAPFSSEPQERFMSAPPSADFLPPESERRIYLPDELPGVRDIATDFDYLLSEFGNPTYRSGIGLEYAQHLRSRYQPGEYSSADREYASQQILPRLYLDAFILRARRDEYQTMTKHRRHNRGDFALAPLNRLIQGKVDFQRDIQEYIDLNPGTDSSVLFANLATIMHHSRRLLFGDEVTHEKAKLQNISQLMAVLAEHKVLAALHEEWPAATFGTTEQDRLGTDIIVPSDTNPMTGVALQIKHSKSPNGDLRIHDKAQPPLINVPMNTVNNDPITLSREHRSILKGFVRTAPHQRIAWAA